MAKLESPIRYAPDFSGMEIDQKRNAWPFVRVQLVGKKLHIYIDCNEGGQVVGEGKGLAAVRISRRKARLLRDFLCDLDLGD